MLERLARGAGHAGGAALAGSATDTLPGARFRRVGWVPRGPDRPCGQEFGPARLSGTRQEEYTCCGTGVHQPVEFGTVRAAE